MEISKKSKKALDKFIKNRKENSGWENHDPEMLLDNLIELGIAAHNTDCWGEASVCFCDDGSMSLHG